MIQDPNNSELQPHYSCTISNRRATIWKHEEPVYRLELAGGNNNLFDWHIRRNGHRMSLDAQMLVDLRRSVPEMKEMRFEIDPNTYELNHWTALGAAKSEKLFNNITTYITELLNDYHSCYRNKIITLDCLTCN